MLMYNKKYFKHHKINRIHIYFVIDNSYSVIILCKNLFYSLTSKLHTFNSFDLLDPANIRHPEINDLPIEDKLIRAKYCISQRLFF